MKFKLLGGAALIVALAMSSGAWANPKNSFSDNNTTTVNSSASSTATGNECIDCYGGNADGGYGGNGGTNYSDGGKGGSGGDGGSVDNSGDSTSTSSAISESYNVSVEGVENSTLTTTVTDSYVSQSNYWGNNKVDWEGASATNSGSGSGLFQASANSGVGNGTTQGQSIGAGAIVTLP